MHESDDLAPPLRIGPGASLAMAAVAFGFLLLIGVVPFLALVGALVVSLVGVGVSVGALNAGLSPGIAVLALVANALAFVLVMSIFAGIG
jgi:hypothetical protein